MKVFFLFVEKKKKLTENLLRTGTLSSVFSCASVRALPIRATSNCTLHGSGGARMSVCPHGCSRVWREPQNASSSPSYLAGRVKMTTGISIIWNEREVATNL